MTIYDLLHNANLSSQSKAIFAKLYEEIRNGNNEITIRELSRLTFSSPATIIRLAKSAGFHGYSDMLYAFNNAIRNEKNINFTLSLNPLLLNEESCSIVDELIADIVSKKYTAIFLQGIGYSSLVCTFFRDKLIEAGYFATTCNPTDCKIPNQYLLIFVSNSGETRDLLKIAQDCNQENCKMYVITSQEKSSLYQIVEHKIVIGNSDKKTYFTGTAIILSEKIIDIINNFRLLKQEDS